MFILNDLWKGNITPFEKGYPIDPDSPLIKELHTEYELFTRELSPEGKEHFEKYETLIGLKQRVHQENAFIDAFRIGAKIMLDVLIEDK